MILDITVAVARNFRSAHESMTVADENSTVHYAGTVDGLAGLISDIDVAGVADGVTLIAALPRQDLRTRPRCAAPPRAVRPGLVDLSSAHSTVFARSACPPQMSTTDSPSISMAIAAPSS